MTESQEYLVNSLELHLFFARIMKEHSLFLSAGFLQPDGNLAKEGIGFLRQFEMLLSRAIDLSRCVVRRRVLESGELVTEFTDCAERQTQLFTGVFLNRDLTARVSELEGWDGRMELCVSPALVQQVRQLNRDGLALVERLIGYKERLLRCLSACSLFTANYPLLIEHILREARLYRSHLIRLEGLGDCGSQELRDSELFWNRIMMEHAMFIRGLLDPGEEALVSAADGFAKEYRRLLNTSQAAIDRMAGAGQTLSLTRKFRDFKQTGVEGIESCKIRSIILPLLADHVLREANHYLRLLENPD